MSQNIDAVRELIMQEPHMTYREIEASLGISSTSIHSILYEHLAIKKICYRYGCGALKDDYKIVTGDESWIYAYESETKQQHTTKVVRVRSTSKQMRPLKS